MLEKFFIAYIIVSILVGLYYRNQLKTVNEELYNVPIGDMEYYEFPQLMFAENLSKVFPLSLLILKK